MKKTIVLALLGAVSGAAALAAPPTVPELLPLVPPAAQVVIAADATSLRAHPLVQGWLLNHAAWGSPDGKAASFLAEAGLDPVRDVTAMVLAFAASDSHGEPVAFFAGRFDAAALAAALAKRGASPVTLAGVAGFRLPEKGDSGAPAVLALPSHDLIVVGGEALVVAALSSKGSRNPLLDWAAGTGQFDATAPFWAVASIPADARRKAADAAAKIQEDSAEPLRQVVLASGVVQSVAVQALLDDSLRLSAVAAADTAENAELLRDTAKGVLAAARLHCQERAPELVNVLRDVLVRTDGNLVTVSSTVPVALIEKLVAAHAAGSPCGAAARP